jgi:GPH family glycoside/pentoside/hexuronide:cation symporter
LNKKELSAFAFLSVPLAMGGLPLGLYLTPYYATELGISLATIGVILMLTRITDVVTDPLIGALSDRTPEKYGRRGVWIALGTPIMAISTIAVFDPFVDSPGPLYLFFAVAFLYLGWTLIGIPLSAWVAEISDNYHERTKITGVRTWGGIVGSILAITAPLLVLFLASQGFAQFESEKEGSLQPMLKMIAWGSALFLIIGVIFLLKTVRQPVFKVETKMDFVVGLKLAISNRAFLRLLASNVLAAIGWNSISTLFIFFVTFYLLADASQWPLILMTYLLGQFLGTPVIIAIAPRFNKHRMLAVCSLIAISGSSLIMLFEPGDVVFYMILNFFLGILAPANAILAPSMAADVIDQDTLESGEQRGALFMSLWGMGDKFAVAAAAGITLPLVQFLGFNPLIENDLAGLKVLHYAYIFVPIGFFLTSVAFIWNFPITRERHAEIQQKLTVRGLLAKGA